MSKRYSSLVALSLIALAACDDDSSTAPATESPITASNPPAWIWAFDDDASKATVYATDGTSKASFTAKAFSKMHLMQAGPSDEPTLWMGNGGTIRAFTVGFHDHGDHAHMETPEDYATLTLGTKSVHMGQSPSGDTVAFADDDSSFVYLIDIAQKKRVRTITHGSSHSAAMVAAGCAITTGHKQPWAKIVDIAKDSVLDSLVIGAGSHGDAYHETGKKAFIACEKAIYVLDLSKRKVSDSIAYPGSGRTNFMYHGHGNPLVVGLHMISNDTSNQFLLLDMSTGGLQAVTVASDASLANNISLGQFALAGNGNTAVFSDLLLKKIYVVDLPTRTVKSIAVGGIGAALAVNHSGTKVWALSGTTVERIDVATAKVESSIQVAAGTDWIHVSSLADGVDVEKE